MSTTLIGVASRCLVTPDGCWEWQGAKDNNGYGRWSLRDGQSNLVHRRSYEESVGPIPVGWEIDHLCRNRGCANPDHLEPVTRAENNRRSHRDRPMKPTCKWGHAFTKENTRYRGRGRVCRACDRRRHLKAREA